MQESGWKYRQGPEPFGSVYVPPGGNVCIGSVLGSDFFLADDKLWKRAEELGIIDENSNSDIDNGDNNDSDNDKESEISSCHEEEKIYVKPRKNLAYISSPEAEVQEVVSNASKVENQNDLTLDDTVLRGSSLALTEKSASKCFYLIMNFLVNNHIKRNFRKDLWLPLWNCIKDEQGSSVKGLGWRYEKSRGDQLGRNFWFCPPTSQLGSKGAFGRDYFTNEESVVAFLLRDIKISGMSSISEKGHRELVDNFQLLLSRAIEDHLPYDEVSKLSTGNSRRQRKKISPESAGVESPFIDQNVTRKSILKSPSAKTTRATTPFTLSPKKLPVEDIVSHSQSTMKGAEILLELNKGADMKESMLSSSKQFCTATKTGIKALIDFRSRRKKRKSAQLSPLNEPPKKKEKLTPEKNAYHLTQPADDVTLQRWVSPAPRNRTNKKWLPLNGFCFFGSGIDANVANAVSRLGGKFYKDVRGEALKRINVVKKLFFLSDVMNRRSHKYLLACALGVPMLQFEWVYALESQFKEYKLQVKDGYDPKCRCPSVFDSKLYNAYR